MDLAEGGNPFFSIDRGVTNMGNLSTGRVHGDGQQASHWKDNLGLGIMDPTAGNGELLTITAGDLRFFDAIGLNWAAVPVPGTLAPFLLAFTVNHLGQAPVILQRGLESRAMGLMGIWSYSIYLWQQPFYHAIRSGDSAAAALTALAAA